MGHSRGGAVQNMESGGPKQEMKDGQIGWILKLEGFNHRGDPSGRPYSRVVCATDIVWGGTASAPL